MKKITDFIVKFRYVLLVLFLILTGISFYLSNKVKINYDMSEYLPKSSETKQGLNIMNDTFDTETSTLNIMFKDLSSEEKNETKEYLKALPDVSSVDIEEKDEYTLYVINVSDTADSASASNIYQEVTTKYEDTLQATSGDITSRNKDVLPFYVVVLAVLSALVILIIMSESYIEPFLFLATILIAVVINKGTNIIFPSVSNITNSIVAILQMALSMDYSIMLMNRYRLERETEKDKIKAMKKALYHAFSSISSSSLTTIVGLLALVFMSFTIGKDLGFALAKGVILSLLSIFTCLPGLIILFDNLIFKLKKKSPIIKLNMVGKISYKLRYVAIVLFLIIFTFSYIFKGNMNIVYTQEGTDQIEEVFDLNNQMAVVYNNEDEKTITKLCQELDDNEKIKDVLCYSNTINESLTYDKLNPKLKDLDSDTEVEEYLLKIVYYHYYNPKEDNKMSLDEFINFIKTTVYNNEDLEDNIDNQTRKDVNRLNNFSNVNNLNKKQSAKEIAELLSLDESLVNDIFTYYNSQNNTTKLTLQEFIKYMNNYILKDSKYSKSIDKETKDNLTMISKFTNKETISKKLLSKEMATLFNLDSNTTKDLYTYYLMNNEINSKMTLKEFTTIASKLSKDPQYSNMIDQNQISLLTKLTDKEFISNDLTDEEVFAYTKALGINPDLLTQKLNGSSLKEYLASLKALGLFNLGLFPEGTSSTSTSPYNLVNILIGLSKNPMLLSLDSETIAELNLAKSIMDSTLNDTTYSYLELSETLGLDQTTTKSIYALSSSSNLKLTPLEFINFILNHQKDEALKSQLNVTTINKLKLLKNIINSVSNNTKYTSSELTKFLNLKNDNLALIYSLYDININKKVINMSVKEFVNLLTSDLTNNKDYRSLFTQDSKNKLNTLKTIIDNTINNKKYTKDEIYNTLSLLSSDLDKNLFDLIYIYYGSENDYNNNYALTLEEFVTYLNNNILEDKRFDDFISDEREKQIIDSKDLINDAKKLLVSDKYSRIVLNTTYSPESEETFAFIDYLDNELKDSEETYVVGDSAMAHEMSKTFQGELNLITILTIIFIFVVVAITFKSILIPITLVLIIQCAIFLTMGILTFTGDVYFISILIVQSILMGATIDYAIVYTSYYLEERRKNDIPTSIINAYNHSIHTILTSASILVLSTLIVGYLSEDITAKICLSISMGSFCSAVLILLLLPAIISAFDKYFIKKQKIHK